MLVGKTGYGPSCKQDDINALMVSLAKAGQARGAAEGRRSADLRPRRRGDRRLPGRRHRGRGRAGHHRGAGRGRPARHSADRPRRRRAALQYVTGHARERPLPADLDWRSLADPATTTAIYMPAKTLAALVDEGDRRRARSRKRPRVAIARATRPDQAVVSAARSRELPRLGASRIAGAAAGHDRANCRRLCSARGCVTKGDRRR